MNISVLWLFLMMPCTGLQCVNVVFPDHTYLLFNLQQQNPVIKQTATAAAGVSSRVQIKDWT